MSTSSTIQKQQQQQSCYNLPEFSVEIRKILDENNIDFRKILDEINLTEDVLKEASDSLRCFSLSVQNNNNKTLPWLMLTADSGHSYRDFYSVAEDKTYRLYFPQSFFDQQCYGSALGWLFIVLSGTEECHLFNPFSSPSQRLPLPPVRTCPGRWDNTSDICLMQYIFKAAVFQFPTTTHHHDDLEEHDNHNQLLVFAIHGVNKNLAYCRSGDDTWTGVEFPDTSSSEGQLDILHLNGQFYSVDSNGSIWLLSDVASDDPNPSTAIPFASPPPMSAQLKQNCEVMFSLIEMEGELHVAVRFQLRNTRRTRLIQIFKCDGSTRKWQELTTLGDYALFLGACTSISVKASDFSACNCHPGYIYFCYADYDNPPIDFPSDMGIINLERNELQLLNANDEGTCRFSLPAWVTPKLL